MSPQAFLILLVLLIVVTSLLVSIRFIWCLFISMRERRYKILFLSATGLICILTALGAVIVVWFGYAVAHTGKDAGTDIMVLLFTVPPFFLVSFGLWLLGGKLGSLLLPDDIHQ